MKSNELDTFILDLTRKLSQLNAQLYKDVEDARQKDKEIGLLKEKNGNLTEQLQKKEAAYDAICEEVYSRNLLITDISLCINIIPHLV